MRTTVVLDDKLVADAREVLGAPTLRALLEMALREAVKARQREMLLRAIGTIDLAITEEDLEEMRRDRPIVADWVARGMDVEPEPRPEAPSTARGKGRKVTGASRVRQSA